MPEIVQTLLASAGFGLLFYFVYIGRLFSS